MIDIDAMIQKEIENGYGDANAQSKVCQDLILKAISASTLNICRYEKDEHDIPSSVIVELAKALQTTPSYLLMGESHEDSWEEDVIRILDWIKDAAMRKLAIRQLQCIADMI